MGLVDLFSRAQGDVHRVYNYLKKVCLPLDTKVKNFATKCGTLLAKIPSRDIISFNRRLPLSGNWEETNRTVSQTVNIFIFIGMIAVQYSLWWLSPIFEPTSPLSAILMAPLMEELAREISHSFSWLVAMFEQNEGHLLMSFEESFTLRCLFHLSWNTLCLVAPTHWFSKVMVLGVRATYAYTCRRIDAYDVWWPFFATRALGQFVGIAFDLSRWFGILPSL